MATAAVNTSIDKAQPSGIRPSANAPSGAATMAVMPCKVWLRPAARGRKLRGTSIGTLAAAAGD